MVHPRVGLTAGLLLLSALCSGTLQARDFTIGRYFTPDPQTATGITGGPDRARDRFGPDCPGMIARQPDHIINVTSELNLRLYTVTDVDSTLVLHGPSGTFCDDDSGDSPLDAEINATLQPGRYEVYIGHIGRSGSYTLTLTENLFGGRDRGQSASGDRGRYGNFRLGAGFLPDPQTATGRSGGGRSASATYGSGCVGQIAASPDHRLTVTSRVNLRIYTESSVDTTLVVVRGNQRWCDDDSGSGLNAEVRGRFEPGEYEIYVGNIGNGGDYTLYLTETF